MEETNSNFSELECIGNVLNVYFPVKGCFGLLAAGCSGDAQTSGHSLGTLIEGIMENSDKKLSTSVSAPSGQIQTWY